MNQFIIILYSIFLSLFTIFSYLFVDDNILSLNNVYSGFAFSSRLLTAIFYTAFIFISFVFYGSFIWLGLKKRLKIKQISILVGVTTVTLFFSYPAMLSYDIFNYIMTSKILFLYHENPYIVMPIELVGESLLSFTHAANKIALYGLSWVLLTGMPYLLGFGNFLITIFSFKLFISIFYLATIFLIWKISKNIIPVILFAFNPLIIIETLIGTHNDIVMIFFALLSFFVFLRKKIFFALLLFILSILIKYTTLLLIPIFLYLLWKTIKREEINWKGIFYFSCILMYAGFLFSPIREEIYPWYAIWFLSFSFLVPSNRALLYISLAFSFGLLFRYIPFMLTGTHADLTPIIKSVVTFTPPLLVGLYLIIKKKLWGNFYR